MHRNKFSFKSQTDGRKEITLNARGHFIDWWRGGGRGIQNVRLDKILRKSLEVFHIQIS